MLKPVDPAEPRPDAVDVDVWPRILEVAAEVFIRSGARMWVNIESAQYVFGYTRPSGGMALVGHPDIRMYRGDDTPNLFDPALDAFSVDDLCYLIGLGKVDPKAKEWWAAAKEKFKVSENAEKFGRWYEDAARDAFKEASMRTRLARMATRPSVRRRMLVEACGAAMGGFR